MELSSWNKVEDGGAKTIYKLMIKKEWTREESSFSGNNSVKGGLGLFKVSLSKTGKRTTEGAKLEELSEDETKAIWLIVAKGQKSTYLIPAVRASKESGKLGAYRGSSGNCWTGVYDVCNNGVSNLRGCERWWGRKIKGESQ
ncbi:hypothetical protein WEN_02545 [Mycoplasma wenyonii str. Massachusetts]|uniref:Uncharacterized protein n=1 Tax=Mycoplasma wenyonii (strain Massachusetts) TaxID=1197325 RepID=I6YLY7_MYCWM|nr:hypothetical protein [Mycoplasma wenyonii]AFN65294.1 hypothetical protein WEN_02545 [Mycoplasma wenyonii str. Massachusetts]